MIDITEADRKAAKKIDDETPKKYQCFVCGERFEGLYERDIHRNKCQEEDTKRATKKWKGGD